MTIQKFKQLIRDGEKLLVEFKRCKDELSNTVYETVSSFSNRYGGYILLGVEDDGEVSGVDPKAATKMKKNFANALNNPQRFAPTLFLALEEAKIDGKTVLWCYVPPNSQVVMFGGRIFDRNEDGDMDITRNSMMVAHIHQRKTADYSERKVFPYAKEEDFDFARLMPKVRRLAKNRVDDHPWENMTDMEIIRSAGLYQDDREAGKTGYNLAAILLFGRDEVIRSCTANYVTDAICRRENLNRYDDRLMVTTNLIDAYEQLIEFIAKHTLDRFHLIGDQSVSLRSKIARELVSNILVHREYTSAYPAKIIIERDRIVTENWSLPKVPGRIDPNNFAPYPKNPLLSRFFINIGRADVLGSGVRNLYQFTKLYSGGEPELIDGDVFKTIVPLSLSDTAMSDNVSVKMSDNAHRKPILAYLEKNSEITAATAATLIERTPKTARRVLLQLVDEGIVAMSGGNRNRIYRAITGERDDRA
jgi:ATP-dependent DNA helicase RecG